VTKSVHIVVADASVLINLMHIARLEMCARLPGFELVVPDHVREEITRPEQKASLAASVERGIIRIEDITELAAIELFADLTVHLGRGEAACLAIAAERGWMVASDEKGRFRREARERIGQDRLLGTPELLVLAMQAGLLTVEDADTDKRALERRRFKMDFASFRAR
jgi:predicted nucleic acid-binding protein